ncbi:hypothetical protein L9F63_016025 [Diploptera punctata]|uniref:Uncharacterized protein n=1 Tax=Diploptera punctata TaxID=6984 RepID=A0AAD8A389_DIPPU|nr:hypothetical protein L9F63_016025 [Diploptera punctata]
MMPTYTIPVANIEVLKLKKVTKICLLARVVLGCSEAGSEGVRLRPHAVPETFPTSWGLRNHLEWHREQANRQRNRGVLPRPATRRRGGLVAVNADGVDDPAVPPTDVDVGVDDPAVPPTDVGVDDPAVPPTDVGVDDPAVPPTDARVLPATNSADATAGPSNVAASPGQPSAGLAGAPVPVTAGPAATPRAVLERGIREDTGQSPLLTPTARVLADLSRDTIANLNISPNVQGNIEEDRDTFPVASGPRPSGTEGDDQPRSAGGAGERLESTLNNIQDDQEESQEPDGPQEIDVDDRSKIHEFLPTLSEILRSGTSDDNRERFEGDFRRGHHESQRNSQNPCPTWQQQIE